MASALTPDDETRYQVAVESMAVKATIRDTRTHAPRLRGVIRSRVGMMLGLSPSGFPLLVIPESARSSLVGNGYVEGPH